jgi:hypothetical protein
MNIRGVSRYHGRGDNALWAILERAVLGGRREMRLDLPSSLIEALEERAWGRFSGEAGSSTSFLPSYPQGSDRRAPSGPPSSHVDNSREDFHMRQLL